MERKYPMTDAPETILIVDDNPTNLAVLFDALEAAHFKVRVATDGEAALTGSLHLPPDLILLDVIMPGLDGFETCHRLKANEKTKDIPVIFITAMSETMDELKGFAAGAVDYITKPIQVDTALTRVKTHLHLRRLQSNLVQKNSQLQKEIAKREQVERRLRLTQFSVDQAADPIFWIGTEGQILYVNDMAGQLLGYSTEELLSLTLYDIDLNYSPDNWTSYWEQMQFQPLTIESRYKTKERHIFPVEVTFNYLEYEGQACSVIFARDITLRRWATQQLFAMEGRYQSLFEHAPISLWEEDWSAVKAYLKQLQEAGVTEFASYFEQHPEVVQRCIALVEVLDVNQATLKLHDATNKAQLLAGLGRVFGPETLETFQQQLLTLVNGQLEFEGEVINYTLSGERKHLVLKQFVAPGFEETRIKVLTAMLDITERKEMEIALRQVNSELDTFARTVAHALKSPLGAIVGYADYLAEVLLELDPEECIKILKRITEAGYKGANIINEILLLAGVRKQEVSRRSIDMQDVVQDAQHQLGLMIEEYKGELILPESWPPALGYAPWIQEVWVNYLSNGLKYGGEPPRLELGATPQGEGMFRFWVRDNGTGLPLEAQARLFSEFIRLEEVHVDGHGLGLSIVRRIMEKLGGEAGVESNGKSGQGCTFYFTLPAARE
jgi:PAS domain S-box-containing protein